MVLCMTVWGLKHSTVPRHEQAFHFMYQPEVCRCTRGLSTHVVRWSRQPASGLWHLFVAVALFSSWNGLIYDSFYQSDNSLNHLVTHAD